MIKLLTFVQYIEAIEKNRQNFNQNCYQQLFKTEHLLLMGIMWFALVGSVQAIVQIIKSLKLTIQWAISVDKK